MNRYTIIGALTRDPESGTTASGVNWCTFTVAARKRYHKEGEPGAEFVRVTAWRGLGDTCAKYLRKGRKVAVVGEPTAHAWIDNNGEARGSIEMRADEVEFVGSQGEGRRDPSDADAPPERGGAARDAESGMLEVDPEDQPF